MAEFRGSIRRWAVIGLVLFIPALIVANARLDFLASQQEEQASPTPSPIPSVSPSPSPTPEVKGTTQTTPTQVVQDPIVECGSDWQRQQGLAPKVKKSVCDSWIDCSLRGYTLRVPDQEACRGYQRQLEERLSQKTTGMVNCETKTGWVVMKREECVKIHEAWKNEMLAELQRKAEQAAVEKILDIERRLLQAQTAEDFKKLQQEIEQLTP